MEIVFNGKKQVFAVFDGFTVKTDQSVKSGGDGEFPEPFTLFIVSLGTCAGIYAKSFCDQRSISTENIKLSLDYKLNKEKKILEFVTIQIHIPPDFPEKYENAMVQAASLCLVKRQLRDDIQFKVSVLKK